jgi:hypothetical protein
VLAVGGLSSVDGLAKSFTRRPADGLRLVGAYRPGMHESLAISSAEHIPVFPYSAGITTVVIQSGADTVVLTSGHLTPGEIHATNS